MYHTYVHHDNYVSHGIYLLYWYHIRKGNRRASNAFSRKCRFFSANPSHRRPLLLSAPIRTDLAVVEEGSTTSPWTLTASRPPLLPGRYFNHFNTPYLMKI